MTDNVKERRLALNDAKAARHTLARVIRMRFRGELDSEVYRDLVYGLNALLGFEKLQKETELERRLAGLENKNGPFVFNVTPQEMDGLDRKERIQELLQKAGYAEIPGGTPESEARAVVVPFIQEPPEPQPEQPQPRRLKL
jgi:hypothetical protein